MKQRFKRRPSPALVVGIIALLVALGGTAVAANTIRSGDIVDGQVKTADLADGAVSSAKVADRTLAGSDLHIRSVGTAELAKLPAVDVRRNSDLPVNPNTPNLVPFDVESFDTADMHAGSGFLVRAPVAGIYRVTAHVSWVGNASATLPADTECEVILGRGSPLDGEPPIGSSKGECSAGHAIEVNRAVRMNGRETLFMVIKQDSDAAFTLDAAQDPVYLDLTWVGPAS